MFDSRVELLGWTAELALCSCPLHRLCQPIIKSPLRALLVLWMLWGQEATLAHFGAVGSQWRSPVCCVEYAYENICELSTKQILSFYPSGLPSWGLKSIEMSGLWKPVVPLNMAVPQHTPCQTWEWECHVQFHGPQWWRGALRGSPAHPKEDIISFTIGHSGVSPRLRGRRPLFCWQVEFSIAPLSLSLFSGQRDGMQCGWLEVRAIAVAGDSLMQTPNYCVFSVHSLCPHSNQITGQMTSSSRVECESAEKRMKDEADARLCVCMRASHQPCSCVHLVNARLTYCQKSDSQFDF